jgi:hypothetical protein
MGSRVARWPGKPSVTASGLPPGRRVGPLCDRRDRRDRRVAVACFVLIAGSHTSPVGFRRSRQKFDPPAPRNPRAHALALHLARSRERIPGSASKLDALILTIIETMSPETRLHMSEAHMSTPSPVRTRTAQRPHGWPTCTDIGSLDGPVQGPSTGPLLYMGCLETWPPKNGPL